jgi:hypothetical protein
MPQVRCTISSFAEMNAERFLGTMKIVIPLSRDLDTGKMVDVVDYLD